MRLLSNSTRGLRKRIVQMFFETIDVRVHVTWQWEFGRPIIAGAFETHQVEARYRSYLLRRPRALCQGIARLPANPPASKSDG